MMIWQVCWNVIGLVCSHRDLERRDNCVHFYIGAYMASSDWSTVIGPVIVVCCLLTYSMS